MAGNRHYDKGTQKESGLHLDEHVLYGSKLLLKTMQRKHCYRAAKAQEEIVYYRRIWTSTPGSSHIKEENTFAGIYLANTLYTISKLHEYAVILTG